MLMGESITTYTSMPLLLATSEVILQYPSGIWCSSRMRQNHFIDKTIFNRHFLDGQFFKFQFSTDAYSADIFFAETFSQQAYFLNGHIFYMDIFSTR